MNALVAAPGLASQIITEHRAGLADAQSAIHHARRAGELLLEAREQFDRGQWLPWLTAHCPEIPERTAQRYMQIARSPELKAESVREAILKLAAPRKPSKPTDKPNNPPRVADSAEPPAASISSVSADGPEAYEPSAEDRAEYEAEMERENREYFESIDRVMQSDDRLAAAQAEIKRQAAEIAALKLSRDGFMNGKTAIIELLKAEQRKTERLSKLIDHLRAEIEQLKAAPQESAEADALRKQVERLEAVNEALKERIGIMEESA